MEELQEIELPINFSPHEDIASCTNALNSVADWDTAIMLEEDKLMIEDIKRMALRIIYTALKEIYTSNYYEEEADTQDNPSETW